MTEFKSVKANNGVRTIYIPDCIVLTLIMGVICGAWGAIIGLVIGACMDIYYACTHTKGLKDERFW